MSMAGPLSALAFVLVLFANVERYVKNNRLDLVQKSHGNAILLPLVSEQKEPQAEQVAGAAGAELAAGAMLATTCNWGYCNKNKYLEYHTLDQYTTTLSKAKMSALFNVADFTEEQKAVLAQLLATATAKTADLPIANP
ncbi:hypothetical protein BDZ91DRAFT_768397 [Kalaharituber pfeilii]|nr:hypothetical protein BDZ91DRAFT_768397 [Kalaharituber pfeilii]